MERERLKDCYFLADEKWLPVYTNEQTIKSDLAFPQQQRRRRAW